MLLAKTHNMSDSFSYSQVDSELNSFLTANLNRKNTTYPIVIAVLNSQEQKSDLDLIILTIVAGCSQNLLDILSVIINDPRLIVEAFLNHI